MTNLLKFTDKFIKMLHGVQNSNPDIDSVITLCQNNLFTLKQFDVITSYNINVIDYNKIKFKICLQGVAVNIYCNVINNKLSVVCIKIM